jgi:segregation and condensation protein A
MGVTVTFVALLELMREGLIEVVQAEAFSPLHVRLGPRPPGGRMNMEENQDSVS